MRSNLLLLVSVAVMTSCSSSTNPAEEKKKAAPAAPVKPPEKYNVKFETTKGDFVVAVEREWAPRAADHFFELVQTKFYDGVRFHRVIRGFVCQFGISPNRQLQEIWGAAKIPDDPVKLKNSKGTVAFAQLGPNSRTTQVFINLRDNRVLDASGFAAFGKVTEGMDVVERLYFSYGEVAPRGGGPDPTQIEIQGYSYLDRQFPRLDSITRATVVP
jgi:cyclophilin family peptidyl-prolyl cis-trans isomerase